MKKFFLISVLSLNVVFVWGQSIFTNPITGTNPNTSNPYIIGQSNDINISVSGISRGLGITGAGANNRYNATSWNTTALDLTAYFEFTLTPTAGCDIDFSNFVYTGQASGTGPTSFAFRSSLDNYNSNIGSPAAGGGSISLSSSSYQNITNAITFRFYGWGASAAGGTFSINDFTFNGITSCGPPSTTLTTTAISSSTFTVNCSTAASGTVNFTSTGTFTAGNTYTTQLSNATGSFTSPINIGAINSTSNSGTINISIPGGTASGTGYRIRVISNSPSTIGTDNGSDISIILNPCTITTGVVSGGPFAVDCSTADFGSIAFNSFGTFAPGNSFTAQLSNAVGSFSSPTVIGVLTGANAEGVNPSSTINFTIPSATASGTGYLIRLISTNPILTSNSSSPFTISLSGAPCVLIPPHLKTVIINSCDASCSEGLNEIVFGLSGDYSFIANTANFNFFYGSSSPTNYTDILVNNAIKISELNNAAGCTGVFVDAYNTTIPAGSSWILANTGICVEALDWAGLCGLGPIYVIFQDDANWQVNGNFANNPGLELRYFRTTITSEMGSTFTLDYTIDGSQYPNSDGVYASFDSDGGPAVSYGDNDCILTPTLLPITLLSFEGEYINKSTELNWKTVSEQNNAFFTLFHSKDGKNYQSLATIQGAGNSTELIDYRLIHNFPHPGINYYKLTSTDHDGTTYQKGIIAIEAQFNFSYYNIQSLTIDLSYESDLSIYSMDGKLIETAESTKSIPFNKSGMFFILDRRNGITERLFIP
jgi:hypothetical protein